MSLLTIDRANLSTDDVKGFYKGQSDTVALLITDLQTKHIVYLCETVSSLFGYCPKEVKTLGFDFIKSIVHPEDYQDLCRVYNHRFHPPGGPREETPASWSQAFRLRHLHGDWLTVRGSFIVRNDASQSTELLYISLKVLSLPKKDILLSPRELEVLQLIGRGFSTKQIAHKLFISIHTAISHRKNIIDKFAAKNTAELIKEAAYRRWLE